MPGPHKKSSDKHKKGEELGKGVFMDTINVGEPPVSSSPPSTAVVSSKRASISQSDREFEKQFEKFLYENFTDPNTIEVMRKLPKEKKWQLMARSSEMKSNTSKIDEKLRNMERNVKGNPSYDNLKNLMMDVEQSDSSVIDQFLKRVGFGPILGLLIRYSMEEQTDEILKKQNIVTKCLRSIVNFRIFLKPFFQEPLAVKACVLTLNSKDDESRETIADILISIVTSGPGYGPVVDYLELQAAANGNDNLMRFCYRFLENKSRSNSVLKLCVLLNVLLEMTPLSPRKMLFEKLDELKIVDKLSEFCKAYKIELDKHGGSKESSKSSEKSHQSNPTHKEELYRRYAYIINQVEMLKRNQVETLEEINKMGNIDTSSDNFNKIIDSLIYDMNSDPNNEKFEEVIRNLKLISKKTTKRSGPYTWRALEGITKLISNKVQPVNVYLRSKEFKKNPISPTDNIWEILKLYGIGKDIVPPKSNNTDSNDQLVKEMEDGRFSLSNEYYKSMMDSINTRIPELEAQAKTLKINIETLEKENSELKEKIAALNDQIKNAPKNPQPTFASMPKFMEDGTSQPAHTNTAAMSSGPAMGDGKPAMAMGASQQSVPAMGKPAMGAPAMGQMGQQGPAMGGPAMGKPAPAMGAPAMGAPAMGKPAMGTPAMGVPAMGKPAMGVPAMGGAGKAAMGAPSMGMGGMGVPKMGMGVPGPTKPAKPKKKNVKPDIPTKKIMWERIADQNVDKTFWNTYGLDDEVVPLDDIKAEFSLENMMKAEQNNGSSTTTPTQSQRVKSMAILPANKSKNMSISLTRTRKSCEEIRKAVIEMNSNTLTQDHLESLAKNAIPDQEDIEKVREYLDSNPGDLEKLPLAEKFVHVISSIPNYAERMMNWAYTVSFDNQLTVLTNELDILTLAFTALKDSSKFKKFLRITLAVGNYMNGGTPQGGAYGFKLGTLTSLRTCKDVEGRRTLLNYILNICYDMDKKKPPSDEWNDYAATVKSEGYDNFDLRDMHSSFLKEPSPILGFVVELSLFIEAKNIGIKENRRDLTELTNNFEKVKRSIDNMAICDENDNYVSYMQNFVTQNSSKLENANHMATKLDEIYSEICTQFGENPDVLTPADLVAKIATFIDNCEVSLNENKSDRESKAVSSRKIQNTKQEQAPETQGKDVGKTTKPASTKPSGKSTNGTLGKTRGSSTIRGRQEVGLPLNTMGDMNDGIGAGLLDDLMSALTDGDGFKTLRRRKR